MPGTAEQKRHERAERQRKGWKRVEVWLEPEEVLMLQIQRVASGLTPATPAVTISDWLKSLRQVSVRDHQAANSSDKQDRHDL